MSKKAFIKERRIDLSPRAYVTVWDVFVEGKEDRIRFTVFDDEDDSPNLDDVEELFKQLEVGYKIIKLEG